MKKVLFHFTREMFVPSILNHGLVKGRVPLRFGEVTHGICLTELPAPAEQKWVYAGTTPSTLSNLKNAFRITVRLKANDPLLLPWCNFAEAFGISENDYQWLTSSGNGHPHKWQVYLGIIPPSAFDGVWSTSLKRFLLPDELDGMKSREQYSCKYCTDERWLTTGEALEGANGSELEANAK